MSEYIEIIGAETHNLKNVSVSIPKNRLVVITGLSGSGKSSLAFDTLYAEGQKRYLESLSTYARMVISNTSAATKVQEIRGLSPTIAIHQKTVSNSPRSTVGTITEIYDFYRLLFANIGVQHCPHHPHISLKKDTIQQIFEEILKQDEGRKIYICFPFVREGDVTYSQREIAEYVTQKGFVRFLMRDQVFSVADHSSDELVVDVEDVSIIVDRLVTRRDDVGFETRLRDSLLLASEHGDGKVYIVFPDAHETRKYSLHNACILCDYESRDLTLSHFSFNSHYGACEDCWGLWQRTTFLESSVINEELTLAEGAILPWKDARFYAQILEEMCQKKKIPFHIPYKNLTRKQKDMILYGVEDERFQAVFSPGRNDERVYMAKYEGVITKLERQYLDSVGKTDAYVKNLTKFTTEQVCRSCQWHRLKKPYLNVKIQGKHIGEISALSVDESLEFFRSLTLSPSEKTIAEWMLKNICERLEFLQGVGLSYMTIHRRAHTLSGGESQRIRLATQIGTRLEGIIYVLDEPSIGLHPRDNDRLITNLKRLTDIGNTVIVVEHDEDIMRESDYIIDIGPGAGSRGGQVVFSGTFEELIDSTSTETGSYLSGKQRIIRQNPKKPSTKEVIAVYGASENNLKDINVRIPLWCMTVVTGVSGSGKSSLVMDILANTLLNHFNGSVLPVGKHKKIEGLEHINKTIIIDQSPIGRTPHSNVATYTGVFTYIREVFAASLDAKSRGFNAGRFSFNTRGGRCEVCEWSGTKKVEMHFLPDVYVECESCGGSRYNPDTLSIQFKGKNIAEVLDMTIEQAAEFFGAFPRIKRILDVLIDVGLGYITLGQSAPTLSGGESQRIKLAFDLSKRSTGKTLYILDEPTTGLHFSDVQKLLNILDALVDKGNSVLIIEHNLDIIANADVLIDIGQEGGDAGGNLIFAWPRDKILEVTESYTGQALKKYLANKQK